MPLATRLLTLVQVHREYGRVTAPDPITISEAARLASCSVSAVATAIKQGRLKAFTGGGVRRWLKRGDVEAWQPQRRASGHASGVGS